MTDRENVIKGLEIVWDAFNHMEHEMYADYVFEALALLKAQEPRVMTLEEVSILGQDVVVWYEHIGVNPPRPRIVHHADNLGIVFTDGGVWLFTEDDYGRKWRCWTSRPTDEQREAVKWE